MQKSQFVQQVHREIEFLLDTYSYTGQSYSLAFAQWVIPMLFPAIDLDQAFQQLIYEAETWGVSAYCRDDQSGTFYIINARYPSDENLENLSVGPGLVYSLLDTYKAISEHKWNGPEEITQKTYEALDDGYELAAILAVFGDVDHQTLGALTAQYEPEGQQFFVYDLDKFYSLSVGMDFSDETISLRFSDTAKHTNPIQALIGNIPALSLRTSISNDIKSKLYDTNIRVPLGRTKVNSQIQATLESHKRRFFWYYNNGITMLCKSFTDPDDNGVVTISSPRIVNGAQTTNAIFAAREEELENVHVMLRLIAALPGTQQVDEDIQTDSELLQDLYTDIARNTNSQNSIEPPDFRANEDVHKKLQKDLAALGWFYERKRGMWEELEEEQNKYKEGRKERKITMPELAQRFYAFEGHPSRAIRAKKSLFEEAGPYGNIFMRTRSAEEYLIAYLVFEQIQNKLKEKLSEAKETQKKALESDGKIPFAARNYLLVGRASKLATAHLSALIGMHLRSRYSFKDSQQLEQLLNAIESEKLISRVFSELEDTLFRLIDRLEGSKHKTLHSMLSESETLEIMEDLFNYVIEREESKGRDVFSMDI